MSERKETPQDRYARKYKKQYSLPCFTTTEMDIISKLESVPNKSGYIKQLIRNDIGGSKMKTYFIADNDGNIYAHDIKSKEKAEAIKENIISELGGTPNGLEILEDE